jgi:hypothetical protein
MTPRQVGELLGFLTGALVVYGCFWFLLVLFVLLGARVLSRPLTLRDAVRNLWIVGTMATLILLQMISRLGSV